MPPLFGKEQERFRRPFYVDENLLSHMAPKILRTAVRRQPGNITRTVPESGSDHA